MDPGVLECLGSVHKGLVEEGQCAGVSECHHLTSLAGQQDFQVYWDSFEVETGLEKDNMYGNNSKFS